MTEVRNYLVDHIELEKHILWKLFNFVRYLFFLKGFVLGGYFMYQFFINDARIITLLIGIFAIFIAILETPWVSKWLLKDIHHLMTKYHRIFIEVVIFIILSTVLILVLLMTFMK